ncbi:alpha/beta fold hydrolase [Allopusillimonas soli]|uniref:Alpha/beta fold hydrolase n=1 Tax=Allopusillimonas soli TaxID=659016 RepID=A0A853FFK8_9BURK|nr:alpha/beta fold hydrolase [Allopusillimonas soli]NYT38677.1 alpha/beta fold hydrolase [Allopusillimonas soli]TEA71619.1 alpha/beta fold hydrolase [Allopusillimonas soli]
MTTSSTKIELVIDDEHLAGTFLAPQSKVPGVLFVHGWGGSQARDLDRARGIAGLGCVCLTFDLRGHEKESARQKTVTRAENLHDIVCAYDKLAQHPAIDTHSIAVVGTSYGAYLSTILTTLRPVKWLSLRVPSLYRDDQWTLPKRQLNREDLAEYRGSPVTPEENRALAACAAFTGDVLIVESEYDHLVPHATIMSYRAAFQNSHSLTHRVVDGADHALSEKVCQEAYTSILVHWITEMVVGARVGSRIGLP